MYPSAPTWAPEKLDVDQIPPMVMVLPLKPRVAAPARALLTPTAVADSSMVNRTAAPNRTLGFIDSPLS